MVELFLSFFVLFLFNEIAVCATQQETGLFAIGFVRSKITDPGFVFFLCLWQTCPKSQARSECGEVVIS